MPVEKEEQGFGRAFGEFVMDRLNASFDSIQYTAPYKRASEEEDRALAALEKVQLPQGPKDEYKKLAGDAEQASNLMILLLQEAAYSQGVRDGLQLGRLLDQRNPVSLGVLEEEEKQEDAEPVGVPASLRQG